MVSSLALDWVGRRLYIAQIQSATLNIQVLALDNPVVPDEIVTRSVSGDTMVKITLSPFAGYVRIIVTPSCSEVFVQTVVLDRGQSFNDHFIST